MPDFKSIRGKWIPKGAEAKVEVKPEPVPEAPKEEVKKEEPKVAIPSRRRRAE